MEESRQKVREVFDKIDENQNGYLELPELLKLSKELGKDLSNYEMKKIIKGLDTDKDGRISFEEFFTWWHYGNEQGLEQLVMAKFKGQKYLDRVGKKLSKIGGLINNVQDLENSEHYVALNVGEAPPKSYLGAKVYVGQEAKQLSDDLCAGFDKIQSTTPSVILKFKVKNAEEAKAAFEDLFEQILALGESLLPPEIADNYMSSIVINYSIPEPNYVCVGITGEHELITQIVDQYASMVEEFIPLELTSSLFVNASTGFTFKDLMNQKETSYSDIIGQTGLNISADLKVNQQVLQKSRELFLHKFHKKHAKGELSYQKQQLRMFLPLFLISGSKLVFNFKSLENVMKNIGDLDLPMEQSLGEGIEMLKGMSDADPKDMIQEIPVAEDILNLFKEQCCSDIQITVQAHKATVQIYGITEGVSDVVNEFLGE